MIRFGVLGAVLVGCKIRPSGIPLEDATKHDDQNTTKTTTRQEFILQRHLLLPLEILVGHDSHARQPDRADSRTEPTAGENRAQSVLQPSSKPAAAGAGRGSREPRSHELKLRFGAHVTARAQKSPVRWIELRACCKRPRSRPVAEPTGAAKNPPHPS